MVVALVQNSGCIIVLLSRVYQDHLVISMQVMLDFLNPGLQWLQSNCNFILSHVITRVKTWLHGKNCCVCCRVSVHATSMFNMVACVHVQQLIVHTRGQHRYCTCFKLCDYVSYSTLDTEGICYRIKNIFKPLYKLSQYVCRPTETYVTLYYSPQNFR